MTVVSDSVVLRKVGSRGSAELLGLVGERPPAIENPGNNARALRAIRSGRNLLLACGGDAPAAGKLQFRAVRAACRVAAAAAAWLPETAIEFSLCRL